MVLYIDSMCIAFVSCQFAFFNVSVLLVFGSKLLLIFAFLSFSFKLVIFSHLIFKKKNSLFLFFSVGGLVFDLIIFVTIAGFLAIHLKGAHPENVVETG